MTDAVMSQHPLIKRLRNYKVDYLHMCVIDKLGSITVYPNI